MASKQGSARPKSDPDPILAISDTDFWAALRVPEGHSATTPHLQEAVQLGHAGRRAGAYRALAAWHEQALQSEWPRHREQAAAQPLPEGAKLEALLNNTINVWHNLVVEFGEGIDWNRQHLGKTMPGFHYFMWFQPAVTHFIQTRDPRTGAWLRATILSYFHALPHMADAQGKQGPGWTPAMNCLSCRGKTSQFLSAYLALLQNDRMGPDMEEAFLKLFLGMGRTMKLKMDSEARSRKLCNGNVSIAGTYALFQLAKLFPEFRESTAWLKRAEERYAYFAKVSFFADGGYCERVWGYGCGALTYLTEGYGMAQRYGGFGKHERSIRKALRKAFRWYAKTLGPRESEPTFGDGATTPARYTRPLDLAQSIFPSIHDRFLGVDRTKSYLLKPSGFAAMRNGDDEKAAYVIISFAKYAGWHSHFEQLSMNLWAFDTPVIEELDRWGPYHNPLDILVRAPEAHNQFLVDGMVFDPRYTDAHDVGWFSNDAVDIFTGCHRAYRFEVFAFKGHGTFNMNGVVRRTVVFVKDPGYALVMDSVYDENHTGFNRAVSQYWHSPFAFRVVRPGLVRTKGKVGCQLAFARTDGLRRLECTADFEGDEVEHAGANGERHTLRARRWGKVEEPGKPGFATVLYPFRGRAPDLSIRPLPTENGEPYRAEGYEIVTPAGRDLVLLNPERREGIQCAGMTAAGRGIVQLGNRRGTFEWS